MASVDAERWLDSMTEAWFEEDGAGESQRPLLDAIARGVRESIALLDTRQRPPARVAATLVRLAEQIRNVETAALNAADHVWRRKQVALASGRLGSAARSLTRDPPSISDARSLLDHALVHIAAAGGTGHPRPVRQWR
jgi:hypothetical protein